MAEEIQVQEQESGLAQPEVRSLIDIVRLEEFHELNMAEIAEVESYLAAVEAQAEEAAKKNPVITIMMDDDYGDVASIELNAVKNKDVVGSIVWTHNLPEDAAVINDGVLTFLKHYEGEVTVTASASNAKASKTFRVACTETVTGTTYEVTDIRQSATEVEADVKTITVYYTGKTISHYQLKEDSVVEQSLSKAVTFAENTTFSDVTRKGSFKWNGKTVNWSVVQKASNSAQPGDVLCSDGSIVRPVIASDGYTVSSVGIGSKTAIGVCVVPTSHMADGKARWMSLDYMNRSTPDTGKQAVQSAYWGGSTTDIGTLTNYPNVVNKSGTTKTTGYLGSKTAFNAEKYLYQDSGDGLYYGNNTTANKIPAPFNADGTKNAAYGATGSAMADMDGKSNTDKIMAQVTATWKTGTIANSYEAGNYPAACCCRRYKTAGTNAGDWYLPAVGELGYLVYNLEMINNVLTALGKIVIPQSQSLHASTEVSDTKSRAISVTTGNVAQPAKTSNYNSRAFLAR